METRQVRLDAGIHHEPLFPAQRRTAVEISDPESAVRPFKVVLRSSGAGIGACFIRRGRRWAVFEWSLGPYPCPFHSPSAYGRIAFLASCSEDLMLTGGRPGTRRRGFREALPPLTLVPRFAHVEGGVPR